MLNFTIESDSNNSKRNKDKKFSSARIKNAAGWILWITLILSIGYSIYRIIITPADAVPPATPRTLPDYFLMLVSCIGGLIVMALPALIEKKFKIIIPDGLTIAYFIFLFAGVFLGEVRNYFHVFKYWDVLLHSFSGAMLAVLGVKLISVLNSWERLDLHLSPFFVVLFGFCFAVTVGVIWEIYEYSADTLLGMNMQKYMTESGQLLIGQEALRDTMEDFIVNVISALAVSVGAFFSVRKKQRIFHNEVAASPELLTEEVITAVQKRYNSQEEASD
ncbi:MAG: hypothetical protein GX034_02130 [Clostridiaceae bacterium]|jgi:hypothetical protein|nr:hypothetical protein [Clostridiaceae bacterium]